MISSRLQISVLAIKQFVIGCMNLVSGAEDPSDVQNALRHAAEHVWSLLRNKTLAASTLLYR